MRRVELLENGRHTHDQWRAIQRHLLVAIHQTAVDWVPLQFRHLQFGEERSDIVQIEANNTHLSEDKEEHEERNALERLGGDVDLGDRDVDAGRLDVLAELGQP